MLVHELMSAPVVTVDAEATLQDAVGRLLAHDVGSVVLVERGDASIGDANGSGSESDAGVATPAGILTASDVLQTTYDRETSFAEIPARDAASSPLVTVAPDRTVGHAVNRMAEEDVRHLPVVDEFDVVGIVTITDVATAYDEVRDEAIDLVGERAAWETEE
ncbi:CBS domain-containing protein [Salinarchaeum chitinilyticum]